MWRRTLLRLRRAARWVVRQVVAGVSGLGHAELGLTHAAPAPDDLERYARRGIAELEAWLRRSAVTD